jgi:signal transduction histidine kinase
MGCSDEAAGISPAHVCLSAVVVAGAKHLRFRADIPVEPVVALGDAGALRRLLLILVDNAVRYTPQGEVAVQLLTANGNPQVRVSDTGIGIPEADLPRVFERFYRSDKSRSRDFGGAGLGLSIARRIAEAHHGSIEARSTQSRGSTFVITLPGAKVTS